MLATIERTPELMIDPHMVTTYGFIDDIPELYEARLEARVAADNILETNRQQIRDGHFDVVAMPVDALGTARRVREAEEEAGTESEDYKDRFAGLVLDCSRLLGEAARKNSFEYFPLQRQEFSTEDGKYYSHSMPIHKMTEAALTPLAEPEEVEIRKNDYVEEISYGLARIALGSTVKVRTVSECPDWAIDAYDSGSNKNYGGYVPEIKKLMIRDVSFEPTSFDRFQEQIGVSGVYITPEVIHEALNRRGVNAAEKTKTELHGSQLLVHDDLVEFVELLDTVASEISGKRLFMGEEIAHDVVADYRAIRTDSESRQITLNDKSVELANMVLSLEKQQVDEWAAVGVVEAKVKHMLFEIAKTDSVVALNAFDAATATGLQDVAFLQLVGRHEEASERMKQVEEQAPAPSYCGAGSCGLESLSAGTEIGQKAQSIGLDASEGLIKDTERSCVKCSKKSVVYDLKGNKGCTSCGATAKYK